MAKPLLQGISTSNSFQVWFDRTNEIVSILNNDVITASLAPGGDITTGDATLFGSFTANTVSASTNMKTDSISSYTNSANIVFNSPVSVEASTQTVTTFKNSLGARTNYSSGSASWSLGFVDTTTNNFMINYGNNNPIFTFVSTGELRLKTITASANVSAAYLFGNGSNITNLNANNIVGAIPNTNIGTVDGSKITGVLNTSTIPLTIARSAVNVIAGDGLTGGGTLTADLTLSVGASVVRTTGNQNISGVKTFTSNTNINGNITAGTSTSNTHVFNGNITTTGNITAAGNITAYQIAAPSDIRLKTNISTIENALDKVSKMRGVYYNYIDSDKKSVGVIAQEIEKVLPEVVLNSDEYKSVTYGNIVGVLIEAIKELKDEVNALKQSKL